MRPFLSARTYDGYAFPADDPRDHRIFPICRKVKALSKYNQAYQLLEYQTCKEWGEAEFDTLGKLSSAHRSGVNPQLWIGLDLLAGIVSPRL